MRRWGLLLVSFLALAQVSGCIVLIATSVGAIGGYAVTRDTIQGEYDVRLNDAFRAAKEVCGMLGTVVADSASLGEVEATVDQARVTVTLVQLTREAVRIKVKARRGLFPRLGTAERVFAKIVSQLM
jgi:hypothetical protein